MSIDANILKRAKVLNANDQAYSIPTSVSKEGYESKLDTRFHDFPLKKETYKLNEIHYVLSNEEGQKEVLETLKNQSKVQDSIHLGFACWFNFDIIAEREPSLAIICDINPEMIALLDLIQISLYQTETIEDFMKFLWTNLEKLPNFPGLLTNSGAINFSQFSDMMKTGGWLSSPASFLAVKNMYQEGRIIHRILDIASMGDTFDNLRNWADHHRLSFDTIYTSNIPEWLFPHPSKHSMMKLNINKLINRQTYAISAWKIFQNSGFPILHSEQGSHPELEYKPWKKHYSKFFR